jgi:lipopolysaccharide transport system ATP-binding protein
MEGFVPKTTIEYKNDNVLIIDPRIETTHHERVNSLVLNQQYCFSYKVKFNISVEIVSFGMKIKTEKGLTLTALGSHFISEYAMNVTPQSIYNVSFQFRCLLLPGTYYIDCGVASWHNQKFDFLNKLVDAFAFKVQNIPEMRVEGLLYLDPRINITQAI